jgi:hypothetical protein
MLMCQEHIGLGTPGQLPYQMDTVTSRIVRLERKYRGCFRCEWCNRWDQVSMDLYWLKLLRKDSKNTPKQIADRKRNILWSCNKDSCIQQRTM